MLYTYLLGIYMKYNHLYVLYYGVQALVINDHIHIHIYIKGD